ncbi:MAG: hypothetical protein IID33_07470 [Planctomycetes bacterium]|nr:hypothetical protein [Planctomycetota bacterium]
MSSGIVLFATMAFASVAWSATVDDKFARNEAIRIALRRPLSDVTFEQVPFREVIDKLRGLLRVNIHVQWTLLDDNGISAKTPISVTLKRITGERLLRLILDDVGVDVELGFAVRDGVLVVSLQEALSRTMSLRTYSVRHLILANRDPALSVDWSGEELKARAERFTSTMVDLVIPDSWVVNGGAGAIEMEEGLLIILQVSEIHAAIKGLLQALRDVPGAGSLWVKPKSEVALTQQRAIHDALNRVQPSVSLTDATLKDALDWLRLMLDVNMHVEWRRLKSAGVRPDLRVELRLKDVSLKRILDQLLSDPSAAELSYATIDGVLIISTAEHLNQALSLRVHEVSDLAPDEARRQRLVQLVTDSVDPDSWMVNGGLGTVAFIADRLVLRNGTRAHAVLDKLLTQMRAHRAAAKPREALPQNRTP